jgi:hypothetical protein
MLKFLFFVGFYFERLFRVSIFSKINAIFFLNVGCEQELLFDSLI